MNASLRRDEIEQHIIGDTAPAAVEAEKALLGIALVDPGILESIDPPAAALFFTPLHGRVWGAMLDHQARGVSADTVLLDGLFAQDETYRNAGGLGWLQDLREVAPSVSRAAIYAAAIRDTAQRRALLRLGEDTSKLVREGETDALEVIGTVKRRIDEIELEAVDADASLVSAPIVARRTVEAMYELSRAGRPRGLMTGLRCVDRRLNGLKPGALIVGGGRPGMGKTALARAILHGAAVRNPNHDFLFFGQEMGPDEMILRELAALTYELDQGVEYRAMESGKLDNIDFQIIGEAEKRVPPNLIFDDRASTLSVDDFRRKLFARQRRRPVGAVVIDYLQLMVRPPAKGRNEASVIGEMTARLKLTARQAGVAIILLSQLSRQVESRDDKKPQLSDLRESGSIEQDADAVLFPFREFYYLAKSEPKKSQVDKYRDWELRCEDTRRVLEVICAKQRGGPEGTDRQRYFAEFDFIEDEHD